MSALRRGLSHEIGGMNVEISRKSPGPDWCSEVRRAEAYRQERLKVSAQLGGEPEQDCFSKPSVKCFKKGLVGDISCAPIDQIKVSAET